MVACGLAVAAASTDHEVKLRARSEESVAKARASIEKQCGKLEDGGDAIARITLVTDLAELADRSFVVEAVGEAYEIKNPLAAEIAAVIGEDTVLASTTSSLSVNKLADAAGIAERFVGFHVFTPVPVMKLIELVFTAAATDDTKRRARELCDAIGKTGVEVPDTPGFVVNRLLFPYLFDAAKFQQETGLAPADVDTCMKLGANMPMGPLALLDYVGMDVSIAIGEQIGAEIPSNCRDLLAAGKLGRKSGAGFYDYAKK